jgi:hypothetical protein
MGNTMKLLSRLICSYFLLIIYQPAYAEMSFNFEYELGRSTDAGHFEFVKYISLEGCPFDIRQFKAIEIFKGDLKAGDLINVVGGEERNGERLLFLDRVKDSYCEELMRGPQHRKVTHWCCAVVNGAELGDKNTAFRPLGNKYVMFYEMTTSESRGPDIPIKIETVYKALRHKPE